MARGKRGNPYRDANGRFASASTGRAGLGASRAKSSPAAARKAAKPQSGRTSTLAARSSLKRSRAKLAGRDPADQRLSSALSSRAQKGAVTRGNKGLKAAKVAARTKLQGTSAAGTISKNRPKPATATATARPIAPPAARVPAAQRPGSMTNILGGTLRALAQVDAQRIREIEAITGQKVRAPKQSTKSVATVRKPGPRSVSGTLGDSLKQLAQSDARFVRGMAEIARDATPKVAGGRRKAIRGGKKALPPVNEPSAQRSLKQEAQKPKASKTPTTNQRTKEEQKTRNNEAKILKSYPKKVRRALQVLKNVENIARKGEAFVSDGTNTARRLNIESGDMSLRSNLRRRKNKLTDGQVNTIIESMSRSASELKKDVALQRARSTARAKGSRTYLARIPNTIAKRKALPLKKSNSKLARTGITKRIAKNKSPRFSNPASHKMWGHMSNDELRRMIKRDMSASRSLRKPLSREFDGMGNRRSGPAMSNQAAREAADYAFKAKVYLSERLAQNAKGKISRRKKGALKKP